MQKVNTLCRKTNCSTQKCTAVEKAFERDRGYGFAKIFQKDPDEEWNDIDIKSRMSGASSLQVFENMGSWCGPTNKHQIGTKQWMHEPARHAHWTCAAPQCRELGAWLAPTPATRFPVPADLVKNLPTLLSLAGPPTIKLTS